MNLVKESISFQRGIDPKVSLGIGQVDLIKKWLDEMGVKNYIINNDMTIDANGAVDLDYKNLSSFPEYIRFNKVEGSFYCDNNNLTSLRGCPPVVKRGFYCSYNQLTSLEGCPSSVGRNFSCSNNETQFTKEEVEKYCKVGGIINAG
jgi:hypothetical protein